MYWLAHNSKQFLTPRALLLKRLRKLFKFFGLGSPGLAGKTLVKTCSTTIAAVEYEGRADEVRKLRAGDKVLLRREPHNRYDANTLAVLSRRGRPLGYIPATIAATLSGEISDTKKTVTAHVKKPLRASRAYPSPNALVEIKVYRAPKPERTR